MDGLAILYSLDKSYGLGWHNAICELDMQIIVNLLIE